MRVHSGQRIPLTVLVDGQDVTNRVSDLSFSNADPGGYEACAFQLPDGSLVRKGSRITILDGLSVAWDGRVGETGVTIRQGTIPRPVVGEGYGAVLKDGAYSMIYVDRDLTRWGPMSAQRRINLFGIPATPFDPAIAPDSTTGTPAVNLTLTGQWPNYASAEARYDAGQGNRIARIYYDMLVTNGPGNGSPWFREVDLMDDDVFTSSEGDATPGTVSGKSAYYTATAATRRFAAIRHYYNTGPAGTQGFNYTVAWRKLAVYGPHGLPGRGADPGGFYPSDIARHALTQSKGLAPGVIVDASGLIVPHYTQISPVPPEQVIADMAKLTGWHWGTWEPSGAFDQMPRFDFRPPPANATAHVTSTECGDLDLADRFGGYYDTAIVAYTDAAGTQSQTTVTLPIQVLRDAGISRTITLNMGIASAGAATAFGSFVLQLTNRSARAAGSVTLPNQVRLPGGGVKPSYMLQAGRDKLRITDLPGINRPLIDDTGQDTYHLRRVEVTTDRTGVPITRAEFDAGANLIEVLQARLELATHLAGG